MFRFHKPIDIVTLFHKASSPASVRAATLLKQASAKAAEADAGVAAAAAADAIKQRGTFDLNITEEPPTADQLRTILEYLGGASSPSIPSVVKGAHTVTEALKKLKESGENFQRPVIVDWNNGKAVVGDKESEILKLLEAQT